MNRNSNKTLKAKSIKYEHSSVETTTHPLKIHHQTNHDPIHNGFSTSYVYGNSPMTDKEKHSELFRSKEPDYGHSKNSSHSHDDNKSKYQGQGGYSKSNCEDVRGNSYQSPTRSPLHGSQSFSKSYGQGKRGDSTGKGKLFTQPFVPRTLNQNGHHRHHAPGQQPYYSSPDTKYISTSPILTVAHSPGSIHAQHSYGIQYTAQQSHYHQPQTTNPASPRSIHPHVPSAPIPIPHSWSAPGMPQYYAVPSSMYDPQQMQYHYYTPYQPPQPSVYSYIPSSTPPLPSYQTSPLMVQQKSPSPSYHTSPSRSSKAIPIINPNTMTPVQTDIHSTSQESKENETRPSMGKPAAAIPIQFIDPAIKEQEERELQEQQEKEQERLEEKRNLDIQQSEPAPEDCTTDPVITDLQQQVEATSVSEISQAPAPSSPDIIQYDPAFLMQFMPLCLETVEDLSPFQNIIDPEPARHDKRQPPNSVDKTMLRSGSNSYSRSAPNGRTEMGKFIGGRPLTGRTTVDTTKIQRDDSSASRSRGGTRVPPKRYEHQGAATIPYDKVTPLEKSANRWVPSVLTTPTTTTSSDLLSQEEITRKVKALLNKLTLERFEPISDKIIGYAKQSINETNGQSLRTVIQLIFEKACDEAAFASMWAQLCRKLYEWIPNDIKDVNTKDKNDDIMCGIPLYCKYLLSRCQHEFEKGWKSVPDEDGLTEEYYQAVKIKRQGLGLVQFIGELYRRDMLSQRIMYQCLKRLCDHGSGHEEEVESLCKLLTTIGADIERNPQTAPWIDVFFERMKNEMYNSANLSSRVKFMILDVFDLRKNHWVPRNGSQGGPKTIAEIHEEAEKQKILEKEAIAKRSTRGQPYNGANRQGNAFRNTGKPPTKRGTWNTGSSPPRHEITDYSNFGRTERSRSRPNVLGPSNNPFPSLNRSGSTQKPQPTKPTFASKELNGTTSNMFSALDTNDSTKKPYKTLDSKQLERRIKNTLAEYYEMTDIEELFTSIKELDQPETQPALALELVGAIEGNEKQVIAVGDLIPKLYQAHLLDRHVLVKTIQDVMNGYDDLIIDVPQAPAHLARLLIQAGIGLAEIDAPPSLQHAHALYFRPS